jgi:hypothetical protein
MAAALDPRADPSLATRPAPAPTLTALDGAGVGDLDDLDELQERAERTFWHDAAVGAGIGVVVCAGLWMVIVAVALIGAGWELGPPLAMAAAVGVFAGAFLGGWAGVMVGTERLESAERDIAARRRT